MSKRAGAVSAETRERLLQAAEGEFAEKGFQASSLRQICAAAGVTTGALYFFFSGKDELFQTVISRVTVPFMDLVRDHYREEMDFLHRDPADNERSDQEIACRLMDFYFQERRTWDVLLGHLSHPAVLAFVREYVEVSTDHYMHLLDLVRETCPLQSAVDRFAVHQFVHMQLDTMITLTSRNFDREEMQQHSRLMSRMLRSAFLALLAQ